MGFGRPGGLKHFQLNQAFTVATPQDSRIENIGKNYDLANLSRGADQSFSANTKLQTN